MRAPRAPAFWPSELSLQSIRGRIALLLAIAFLPAGALALQAGVSALTSRQEAVQGARGVEVLQRLNITRDEITQAREIVRTLAANPDLSASDATQCSRTLREYSAEFPEIAVLAVVDRESTILCSSLPSSVGQKGQAETLIAAADRGNRTVVGYVETPNFADGAVFAALAPTEENANGQSVYVAVSRAARPLLQDVLSREVNPNSFVAVVNRRGEVLDSLGLPREAEERPLLGAFIRDSPQSAFGSAFRLHDHWVVATPLEQGELYLVEGWKPVRANFADMLRAGWALFAPMFLWLAAVAAAWYAVEIYVARPLLVVEGLARSYARGEDSEAGEELLRGAPVEIANLRRTLAAMAKTLRGREARLAEALDEERALLLEVNHRVKNNLQMVASILSIQARGTSDASEARGLSRAQDRVQLLALAHTRVYGSGAVREIPLERLAGEVGRTLIGRRGAEAAHIKFSIADEGVRAGAERAVPLAFMIGETISALLDLMSSGDTIDEIRVNLLKREHGGFAVEIDAVGEGKRTHTPEVTRRLKTAFARQIGAELVRDENRPNYLCIEVPPAAGEEGDEAKAQIGAE